MINFKVGIVGFGKTADIVADTLSKLDAFEICSVADSRDKEAAAVFRNKHDIKKCYDSCDELAGDPEVELVYISAPSSIRAEYAKKCLSAGKPVLVERTISYNSKTTQEVLNLAKEKNLFCGEAMHIRFLPMYQLLVAYIQRGVIGRVKGVSGSLGYYMLKDSDAISLESAGGSLTSLGVYFLNLLAMVYGSEMPMIGSSCTKLDTGVDAQESLQISYKGGKSAGFFSTILYQTDNTAKIYGERGYIEIDNILYPEAFRIYTADHNLVLETKKPERQTSGYEFEFLSARDAIITGRLECTEMPHAESLRIMQICDSLRSSWQIKYPME